MVSDNSNLVKAQDAVLIHSLSSYVYQMILTIQQQHPQWLNEPFRDFSWQNPDFEAKFNAKLVDKISNSQDIKSILNRLLNIFSQLFSSEFFAGDFLVEFTKYFQQLIYLNGQQNNNKSETGNQSNNSFDLLANSTYAILLLDAENLSLDVEIEKILERICNHPIKKRLAFANWRSLGKKDLEFHGRGYELIHVPAGKNSADLKMISVGLSISVNYPTAKEIFICSSDGDFNHLCTLLHNWGLTVYRVSRNAGQITIVNNQTGQATNHSLLPPPQLPSLDNFIAQLREIIQEEQQRTKKIWIELAKISQLFKSKHGLNISQVVAHHFPGKRARDIFFDFTREFCLHQISAESQLYVTLFDGNLLSQTISETQTLTPQNSQDTAKKQEIAKITSPENLALVIMNIVKDLISQSQQEYIPISNVASQFRQLYNSPITQVMSSLKLGSKLVKLLQSYPSLNLKKLNNNYEVGLNYFLNSPEDLEAKIIEIVKFLQSQSQQKYIPIIDIASEFFKKYNLPITKSMKYLGLKESFPALLQTYNSLKLKKDGKITKVAISTAN